jgi:iron complex outermembrane receptor protein
VILPQQHLSLAARHVAVLGSLAISWHVAGAEEAAAANSRSLLDLSLEELMDVRVSTVAREESTIGQSPAAVSVITPDMIRRSGATTFPEILRMVPGLNVAHIDSNKWVVGSRGFGDRFSGKLLVQIDGRTVYNPINAGVYWDAFDYPLEDIERIEVIRGPGASVWGSNAVNGVINIVTKPAKDTLGGLVSGGSGTEDRGLLTFRYGGRVGDNLQYRVYGKWFERDRGFNLGGDARDDWRQGRFGFRIDWQPHPEDSITFQGEYFHGMSGRRDLRPAPGVPPLFIRTNTEDEETMGGDLLVRWAHELGKDSNWVLQMYYDTFNRRGTGGLFDFSINAFDVDFQHQFHLGDRQKVVWGAGYRLNRILWTGTGNFDNGFSTGPVRRFIERPIVSLFVQDEIQIVPDRFSLMLGAKIEHNEYTGFEYQPTARLLWTPTKRQSIWASVSRAVRTPSFLENDVAITVLPIVAAGSARFPRIIGNPELDSEELIAYELGYRAQASSRLSIDAALFYNCYSRLFATQPGTPFVDSQTGALILPSNRTNGGDAETYGVELAANWRLTRWWRLYGAYTFLKMNLHGAQKLPASSRASLERIEGQSPENQFYIRSSFDLPHNVEFDLTGRYSDNLPGFTPGIRSYITMDARLAWKATPNLEFSIVGQNLLDNHHPEFGTSPLVRSPLVEVERSVMGMITFKW